MFFPEGHIRVFLYGSPVDMRRSYDGLCAITRHQMKLDPINGNVFVFVNRRGTQWVRSTSTRSGFCIGSKRLAQGRFVSDWSRVTDRQIDWTGLKMMLEGIEPKSVHKRYKHSLVSMQGV